MVCVVVVNLYSRVRAFAYRTASLCPVRYGIVAMVFWGQDRVSGVRIGSNGGKIDAFGIHCWLTTPSSATDAVSLTAALQPYSGIFCFLAIVLEMLNLK